MIRLRTTTRAAIERLRAEPLQFWPRVVPSITMGWGYTHQRGLLIIGCTLVLRM